MFGACDPGDPAPRATPSPTPTRSTRAITRPDHPRVVIESAGPTRVRLEMAVRDLKRVGVWRRLTDHLYEIELDSRSGSSNVPDDGHLADAYFTGVVDERGSGPVCDVMFFPSAVTSDLARWRQFFAAGAMAEPPPTLREFYGSLLAHELAHCADGPRGEAVAQAWERRALARLRVNI